MCREFGGTGLDVPKHSPFSLLASSGHCTIVCINKGLCPHAGAGCVSQFREPSPIVMRMFMSKGLALFLLIAVLCGVTGGCGLKVKPVGPVPEPATEPVAILSQGPGLASTPITETVYRVGPHDRLDLKVWRNEEFSRPLIVSEDGTAYLPGIGNVVLGGLTLTEARDRLIESLRKFVKTPDIELVPMQVRSSSFTVLGAVGQAGRYPLVERTDVITAIAVAGGVSGGAWLDRLYLGRDGGVYTVSLRRILTRGDESVYLKPGDVLYVPTQADQRVYVMGEVNNPGAVVAAGTGLDLLGAISAAGGFADGAKPEKVGIMRPVDEQVYTYVVDVADAFRGRVPVSNMQLEPGDIVYVPRSGIGNWNRILRLIQPTLKTFVFDPLGGVRDFIIIRDGFQTE